MTTAIKNKRKIIEKSTRLSEQIETEEQKTDEAGLGALMGLHLPRSFQSPAEVDAYIRSLRDAD